jgi:putative acetyltransferase
MIIRDETPHDRADVREVVASAFGQIAEAELVERLVQDGDCVIALVAEDADKIVGHALLSRMAAPFPALALAPVSVAPSRRRCGIGSALVTAVIDRARSQDWAAIFVLGDLGYYQRFGFRTDAAAGFASPYAGEHFMMLALSSAPMAASGELRHAPAFADLG